MVSDASLEQTIKSILKSDDHSSCNYFSLIKTLAQRRESYESTDQRYIEQLYAKVRDEIIGNTAKPVTRVKFGTSGWRGILGKDLFCKSVAQVTLAIIEMYKCIEENDYLADVLGVKDIAEARSRGCVIGFDNRFCGDILCRMAVEILHREGIKVYYAGESTTGVLSAAVLQLEAAFSINFTPSHNPLEYGGLKFNAADGGPAAEEATRFITEKANEIIDSNQLPAFYNEIDLPDLLPGEMDESVIRIDSFALWEKHVLANENLHGIPYREVVANCKKNKNLVVVIDSVHGASRLHIPRMFSHIDSARLLHLRNNDDVTFGGVAPEPSSENIQGVVESLQSSTNPLKIGAIIDPDGDRIRFTDGKNEISMNQFGAMAYHFLHEYKKKKGMVAKTVATSNLANQVAQQLGEKVFEPRVGFKEFKPVVGSALVCFEESDGISIIGHTPEKDAYIGLILAIDMVLTTGKNLGDYLHEIESTYGFYYPDRDGIEVAQSGEELLSTLAGLEKYDEGVFVQIGDEAKKIVEVIDIDGRKMILDDGSWLMIRPSGTEPKVRFYVESRTADGTKSLVEAAKRMLGEVGLI